MYNSPLRPDDVTVTVDQIGEYPNSYLNHEMEDELYECVLRAIATGQCTDPVACANEALKTKDFPFPRYMA